MIAYPVTYDVSRRVMSYPNNLSRLECIIPPSEEPLTLAEVKIHHRMDFIPEFPDDGSEDTMLAALISVARRLAENETRRALMPQTWRLIRDDFLDEMRLPWPPIQALSIRYRDLTGVWQNLDPAYYRLSPGDYPTLYLSQGYSWPSVYDERDSVEYILQCGYNSASDVPVAIKQWMQLKIGELYEFREASSTSTVKKLPFVDGLLDLYRVNPIPYIEAYL